MDIHHPHGHQRRLRGLLGHRANGLEIHQRLVVREPLRAGIVRHPDVKPDGHDGSRDADALPRPDDRPVLRLDRYDLRPHAYP